MQGQSKLCVGSVWKRDGSFHSYGLLVGTNLALCVEATKEESLDIDWGSGRMPLTVTGIRAPQADTEASLEGFALYVFSGQLPLDTYEPPAPLARWEVDEMKRVLWGTGEALILDEGVTPAGTYIHLGPLPKDTPKNLAGAPIVDGRNELIGICISRAPNGRMRVRQATRIISTLSGAKGFRELGEPLFWTIDPESAASTPPDENARADSRPHLVLTSDSVQEAYRWIRPLVELRGSKRTPQLILVGLLRWAEVLKEKSSSAHFLERALQSQLPKGVANPLDWIERPESGPFPDGPDEFLGPDFAELGRDPVFARAKAIAIAVGAERVHVRHLVGAFLIGPESIALAQQTGLFGESGIDVEAIVKGFREFVSVSIASKAEVEGWLLLWGTGTADAPIPVEERARLAGYHADLASGMDHLDIQSEVETLCNIVLDRSHPPPLSIGLFADWGAGKSFFLGKMAEQIKELAEQSRMARKAGLPSAFVEFAPQIEFNAWHYVDANLWASLVTHLFTDLQRQLFGAPASASDTACSLVKQLYADLETTRKRVETLEREKSVTASHVKSARDRVTAAGEEVKKRLDLRDAWYRADKEQLKKLLLTDGQVMEQVEEFADKLSAGKRQADELRSLLSEVVIEGRSWWRLVRERPFETLFTLGAAGMGAALVLPEVREFLQVAGTWISGTGVVSWVTVATVKARNYLGRVRELREVTERARGRELDERERKFRAAEERQSQATGALDEERRRIAELTNRIEEVRRGVGLEGFLQERLASAKYKEQLGIVAMVRRDLETLTTRLRQDGIELPDLDGRQKIDRVVLYIDDLDRCSPERVVEVLQAVHLLLAVPLFVVVVAADPRWLLHSLRWHYAELWHTRAQQDESVGVSDNANRWQATPHQYLEKIFQIPYTLQRMDEGGYRKLVESLVSASGEDEVEGTDHPAAERTLVSIELDDLHVEGTTAPDLDAGIEVKVVRGASSRAGRTDDIETTEKPGAASDAVPTDWAPSLNLTPRSLSLGDDERVFLGELSPLLATPRSAKRLVNVYRLLRANLTDARLKVLRSGEFRSAQLLLGVLVGFPDIAAEFFHLVKDNDSVEFWSILEQVAGSPSAPKQQEEWERLLTAFRRIAHNSKRPELPSPAAWVDEVSRYSFRAGHLLRMT